MMASLELDPLFRRGLRLLHSRTRESTDQLESLLHEAIRQRQGKTLTAPKDPFNVRRESPVPRSKPGSPIPIALTKREDNKREHSSKLRDEDTLHPKRLRVDSPSTFKSHTPSPTPSIKSESSSRSRKSEDSDSESDMNSAMDALTDGINCCICKRFDICNGNTLFECQECHQLYHQECHRPPIVHQDMTADPRVVWYCAKCTRMMKKQTGIVGSSGNNGSSIGSSRSMTASLSGGSNSSSNSSTSSGNNNKGSSSMSSRANPSPSKVSGMQRPSPFANLASASGRNIGSNSNSSSSSSNSSSSSGSGGASSKSSLSSSKQSSASSAANSMLSAERRMQMMKKKAAAKLADRRNMKMI